MDTPSIDVVRACPPEPMVSRADDGSGGDVMAGHFSVFNNWYRVVSFFEGEFMEQVARGAFTESMSEDRSSIKVTFNHGHDVLGDQVLGPIRELREDRIGAYYEVPLFAGVPDLLREGLASGVYGSSFRFQVLADAWDDEPEPSDTNPKGLPERTVQRVRLMEFGPVTFPANPDATAGIRSLTDRYYDQIKLRDTGAYEAAVRAAKNLTAGRPSARSMGSGETGTEPGNGDVSPHHPNRAAAMRSLLLRRPRP